MESTTKQLIANAIGHISVFKQLHHFFVVIFSSRFRDVLCHAIDFEIFPKPSKLIHEQNLLCYSEAITNNTTIN